ncbi:MAG: hypothetical protein WC621_04655 [Patescibacteria group bacterium]
MRLSPLQKYLLRACYFTPTRVVGRSGFVRYYDKQPTKPKADDVVNIITKSLESLIDKGLMIGYGVRTPRKWFIKEVRLSAIGRRAAKKLLGEQQKLPFKTKTAKIKKYD